MAAPPPDPAPIDDEARAREIARVAVLRIVVMVLGGILVALAVIVFSTLILRAVKGGSPKPEAARPAAPPSGAAPAVPAAALPAGARVLSTALGDGRLAVTVEAAGEVTVILFDAATLAETGRVVLQPR
jgi:hypothetical protein